MKKPLIFLDLDDTILDFHWAEHRALSRTFREAGLDPQPEILARYSDINRSQWELLERGILTREQVLVRRFRLLFEEQGIPASAEELGRRYKRSLCAVMEKQVMLRKVKGVQMTGMKSWH